MAVKFFNQPSFSGFQHKWIFVHNFFYSKSLYVVKWVTRLTKVFSTGFICFVKLGIITMLRHSCRKFSFSHTNVDSSLFVVGVNVCVCSFVDVKVMTTFCASPNIKNIFRFTVEWRIYFVCVSCEVWGDSCGWGGCERTNGALSASDCAASSPSISSSMSSSCRISWNFWKSWFAQQFSQWPEIAWLTEITIKYQSLTDFLTSTDWLTMFNDLSHLSMMSGGLSIRLSLNWSKYFISVSSRKRVWREELNFFPHYYLSNKNKWKVQQLTKFLYKILPFYFNCCFNPHGEGLLNVGWVRRGW